MVMFLIEFSNSMFSTCGDAKPLISKHALPKSFFSHLTKHTQTSPEVDLRKTIHSDVTDNKNNVKTHFSLAHYGFTFQDVETKLSALIENVNAIQSNILYHVSRYFICVKDKNIESYDFLQDGTIKFRLNTDLFDRVGEVKTREVTMIEYVTNNVKQRLRVVIMMALAVYELHGLKYTHNAINPSNFLYGLNEKNDVLVVKLYNLSQVSKTGVKIRNVPISEKIKTKFEYPHFGFEKRIDANIDNYALARTIIITLLGDTEIKGCHNFEFIENIITQKNDCVNGKISQILCWEDRTRYGIHEGKWGIRARRFC